MYDRRITFKKLRKKLIEISKVLGWWGKQSKESGVFPCYARNLDIVILRKT